MTNVWFTSDLHIGHRMVAELRGFTDPADHDDALAANWDRVVRPDHQVWVLGDISVGGKANEIRALEWIAARPGTKHLVAGNHDSCHPYRSQAHKWQRIYLDAAFASVQQSAVRKIAGQRVLLSHFPFQGSEDGDHTAENRFEEWRLPRIGENTSRWLLHGHTHSRDPGHGPQLHVGLDAHALAPVPLDWVEYMIESDPPF
ncbi:putative bacteriophage protein [Nocardia nova SH22a]|uniref:Putative bacteriophage protein n=1 Tax=Nocardia nova SH22a TaxID=1415166 RepID=W5TNA0_9NOCA|nr:metallophosphoesterase family protein [Nocardia nova]AHH20820.1 putative bacteriophage protein [Nocardia nova SH22a]